MPLTLLTATPALHPALQPRGPLRGLPLPSRWSALMLSGLLVAGLLYGAKAKANQDFIVGVSTHALEDGGPLARPIRLMLEAGVGSVREQALWSIVEPQPGELQIVADWPRYLDALQEKSLQSVLVLGAGNPNYLGGAAPRTDALRKAFGRYVDYLSHQFSGQVGFYELWSEWDAQGTELDDSEAYVRLVRESAARLRHNDPAAKILAGGISSEALDRGFAERLIADGLLEGIDGLSLHPFVDCRKAMGGNTPESWMRWLDDIAQRINTQAGRTVPLYLTATGWPSGGEGCAVSENTQAAFVARSFLLARSRPNIKGMWWHDLVDRNDQRFGLLRQDLSEKPAYAMLKTLAPLLSRYRYTPDPALGRNNLYLMEFATNDDHLLVAWAIGQARQVKIETRGDVSGPVQLLDTRQGHQGLIDSDNHWLCQERRCTAVITLSEFPQLISLGKPSWLFIQ